MILVEGLSNAFGRPCWRLTARCRGRRLGFMKISWFAVGLAIALMAAVAEAQGPLAVEIDRSAALLESKVVAWRRDIHQHPELGNREVRTAGVVAAHLRALGLEVRERVAHTGVVGVLRGGLPGPVVALRADMDALPVTEQVDLPFASRVRTIYNGQEVGVMHACGHDLHVAILMGAAEVLAGVRDRLPGTVVFLFQPAEEGAPEGETGGARQMIAEGALENPAPEAIFGLHVGPGRRGRISTRSGSLAGSSDPLRIVVRGRQSHGGMPWRGVDPIVASAQVVVALQTVTSRQMNLTEGATVVTIGSIQGGVRGNIIPDSVVLLGTIRALHPAHREEIHRRVRLAAERAAEAVGATAEVTIDRDYAVTYNDPALTERMAPTLRRVSRDGEAGEATPGTWAEDFSFYQERIPGMYFLLGATPDGTDPASVAGTHSPEFFADEGALPVGVRAMSHLAVDYLAGGPQEPAN